MLEEKFHFMYLSKSGTDIKHIGLSLKQFFFYGLSFFLIIVIIGLITIGLFTNLFHSYRIKTLENDRAHLQKELLVIKERVVSLADELNAIGRMGDELRNVASLPPIDNDMRQVGVGGPLSYGSLDFGYYPDEISKTAVEIKLDLDKFERAVKLEKSSMEDVASELFAREDRISHFPSICPILGGRITEEFGFRIDPFTGKIAAHKGIDIPMPKGTSVLATADGVVKVAKTLYTLNKSYGQEVVIDHGYGYLTRYAHRSKRTKNKPVATDW
jgi:murein DD-endopeptidase MepM/ murein hydrolase activator NlpD